MLLQISKNPKSDKFIPQIYLISPPKIDDQKVFLANLNEVLATKLVPIFQLRLKEVELEEIAEIAPKIQEICRKNNCVFLLNDHWQMSIELGLDGVHVGVDDANIFEVRSQSGEEFIIGASCYDQKDLAQKAANQGANYVSYGAFFETKTKVAKARPDFEIITWSRANINLPISVIGGINSENCKNFAPNFPDFICVISAIWNHKNGAVFAVKELHESLKNYSHN